MSVDNVNLSYTSATAVNGMASGSYQIEGSFETKGANGVATVFYDGTIDVSKLEDGSYLYKFSGDMTLERPTLDAPKGGMDAKELKGLLSLPSFGCELAAFMVEYASENLKSNRTIAFMQGMALADNMDAQADKIREGAIQKFACAVTGSAISIVGGIASGAAGLHVAGGLKGTGSTTPNVNVNAGGNITLGSMLGQSINTSVGGVGNIFNAAGDFAQGLRASEGKELEAEGERLRAAAEQTKQTVDTMRQVVNKSLDSMSELSQSANRTRSKILG